MSERTTTAKLDGARVRAARERKGWSRERLAVEAEMSFGAISKVEDGTRTSFQTFAHLADVLGVSVKSFIAQANGNRPQG